MNIASKEKSILFPFCSTFRWGGFAYFVAFQFPDPLYLLLYVWTTARRDSREQEISSRQDPARDRNTVPGRELYGRSRELNGSLTGGAFF